MYNENKFTLRLDPELDRAIRQKACGLDLSVNKFINLILAGYIKENFEINIGLKQLSESDLKTLRLAVGIIKNKVLTKTPPSPLPKPSPILANPAQKADTASDSALKLLAG